MSADSWGVISGIVSVLMGGLSIWLSLHFYTQTNRTERSVTNSLTKIEAQADALQKINAKWMDRLTKYVTEDRPHPLDNSIPQLLEIVRQSQAISAIIPAPDNPLDETMKDEIINCYIIIYYYSALCNYWAQFMMPDINEFNEAEQFHVLAKNCIDGSAADFKHFAKLLSAVEEAKIEASVLKHMFVEARDLWRTSVRSVADILLARGKLN